MNQDYTIRELDEKTFTSLFAKLREDVFENVHSYDFRRILNEDELEKLKRLAWNTGAPYKLHLAVFDRNEQCVGWSWGFQENASTFYMVNSAVLPDHRRKGLYSSLLQKAVETLGVNGFQLIYSRHCATNNAVIIPKLKAGFVISKMEIDDRSGVLIHLHFYTNETRRRMMDYRCGQQRPDQHLRSARSRPLKSDSCIWLLPMAFMFCAFLGIGEQPEITEKLPDDYKLASVTFNRRIQQLFGIGIDVEEIAAKLEDDGFVVNRDRGYAIFQDKAKTCVRNFMVRWGRRDGIVTQRDAAIAYRCD